MQIDQQDHQEKQEVLKENFPPNTQAKGCLQDFIWGLALITVISIIILLPIVGLFSWAFYDFLHSITFGLV